MAGILQTVSPKSLQHPFEIERVTHFTEKEVVERASKLSQASQLKCEGAQVHPQELQTAELRLSLPLKGSVVPSAVCTGSGMF